MPSRACCVLALVLLGACASKPSYRPDSEVLGEWLAARPRTLALELPDSLPEARVRTRDPRTGMRIAMVPVGAAVGVIGGMVETCSGGVLGCLVGIVISPVMAVVGGVAGAASVQPIDQFASVAEVAGAPELLDELRGERVRLADVLRQSLHEAAQKSRKHKLVPEAAAQEGTLHVSIADVMLSREVGDESKLGLILAVRTDVRASVGDLPRAARWHDFVYLSPRHSVAEWMANDARRLREEVKTAAAALSPQIIAGLDRTPPKAPGTQTRSSSAASTYPRLSKAFVPLGNIEAVPPFPAGELVLLEHTIAIRTERHRAAWVSVNLARPTEKGELSFSTLLVVDCPAGTLEVSNSATNTEVNGEGMVKNYETYEPARQIAAPDAALLKAHGRICSKPDPYRTTRP